MEMYFFLPHYPLIDGGQARHRYEYIYDYVSMYDKREAVISTFSLKREYTQHIVACMLHTIKGTVRHFGR